MIAQGVVHRDAVADVLEEPGREHVRDVGPGLEEVAVVGLRPAGIGRVTGAQGKQRAAGRDLLIEGGLIWVGASGAGGAPVAEYRELERVAASGGGGRREHRRGVTAQQVSSGGGRFAGE